MNDILKNYNGYPTGKINLLIIQLNIMNRKSLKMLSANNITSAIA
jgi:hypothetical protein